MIEKDRVFIIQSKIQIICHMVTNILAYTKVQFMRNAIIKNEDDQIFASRVHPLVLESKWSKINLMYKGKTN